MKFKNRVIKMMEFGLNLRYMGGYLEEEKVPKCEINHFNMNFVKLELFDLKSAYYLQIGGFLLSFLILCFEKCLFKNI